MLDVTIISVGSIKEPHWRAAVEEYLKRLAHHAKVTIIEVPEEKITKVTDRERIISVEAERIIRVIPKDTFVIALDRAGKMFSSREWADQLDDWSRFGKKITFVIGGPLGVSPLVLKKATVILSLAKMTFTHQMSRVILLEQLYRAGMILSGSAYHY
ncbi:MAG: 23S rRNA (pseudouridine(1915)-N(3))-methyltransferase RlmH [Patescibacteria group bacterium]